MKTTSALFAILRNATLFTLLAVAPSGASATVVRNLDPPAGASASRPHSASEKIHFSRSRMHQKRPAPLPATAPIHNKLVHAPEPAAGAVAADLFWVADSRKMDAFLAQARLPEGDGAVFFGEVLPDTRTAWRDYAREARTLASQGRVDDAAERLAQMLKLAAVYRAYGGMENVVQGEEIRYLAGRTAEELGSAVTSRIQSPYLERDAEECLAVLKSRIGSDLRETTEAFRKHLANRALETHGRLSQAGSVAQRSTP